MLSFPALSDLSSELLGQPLDGTGTDIATGNNAQPDNEEWVKGLFGLAFRFDGDDALRVPRCNKATAEPWNLDMTRATMLAWIRPQGYAIDYEADRGIIMNKENSYEFGLADNTGALQGAFSPCWRWWGEIIIPLHEWSHVAVSYDGTNEAHFIMSQQVEAIACGNGGDLTPSQADFRIGHREARVGVLGHSNFQGDIDEAMVFDRALGESELHGIYRGHYRHSHTAGSRNVQASHSLVNNDVSGATGHKSTFARVSQKLIDRIDSLIGYWPLDGDASDSSGNGLDGRVPNPEWVSGVYGLAIAFAGDDGLEVSAGSINALTVNDVTMAAWIKAEAGGNTGATFESTEGMIMCRDEAYEIALKSGTGELQAAFGTGGGTTELPYSAECWAWFGQQIIPAHEWVEKCAPSISLLVPNLCLSIVAGTVHALTLCNVLPLCMLVVSDGCTSQCPSTMSLNNRPITSAACRCRPAHHVHLEHTAATPSRHQIYHSRSVPASTLGTRTMLLH